MVSSVLDRLPPEGLSAGREPRRVPLQAPPVGSLLIRLGRDPGGMYPFLIHLSALSWAPRLLQLREGLFGSHPAPSPLFRLSDLSAQSGLRVTSSVSCSLRE